VKHLLKKVKKLAVTQALVDDFLKKCPATAAKTGCPAAVAKVLSQNVVAADKTDFESKCKVEAPSSGENGDFTVGISNFLLLLTAAFANFYFFT
jgi:hypothetical protein